MWKLGGIAWCCEHLCIETWSIYQALRQNQMYLSFLKLKQPHPNKISSRNHLAFSDCYWKVGNLIPNAAKPVEMEKLSKLEIALVEYVRLPFKWSDSNLDSNYEVSLDLKLDAAISGHSNILGLIISFFNIIRIFKYFSEANHRAYPHLRWLSLSLHAWVFCDQDYYYFLLRHIITLILR